MEPFNEAKYKALMDGLEAVEIDLSVCKSVIDFRIDANTYKKEYVKTAILLQSLNVKSVEDLMVSIQNFGAYSLCNLIEFTDVGIPFLMTQNVQNNYIDWSNLRYVNEQSHLILHKSHCKKGQVLVTMAGEYLGRVAVYDKDFICSSNQAIAKITLKSGVSPYYISTFLTSRFGQNQIQRFKTITGQPNINMALIKSLIVPMFSTQLYDTIEDTVMSALQYRNKAVDQYRDAEVLLLSALNYQPIVQAQNYSKKSFLSSFSATGRLDAEYYQSKYDEYLQLVQSFSNGWTRISDVFTQVKTKCTRDGQSYRYVEIGDIDVGSGTATPHDIDTCDLPDNAKIITLSGDILVSTVRPNRGAVAILEEDDLLVSGAFTVLRQKAEYPKEVLQVLLRTPLYKDWLLQTNVGTSYPVIKDGDVLNMPIPVFIDEINLSVLKKIQESSSLRRQSKQLLENAKHAVEMAIEQGEDTAMRWLQAQGEV